MRKRGAHDLYDGMGISIQTDPALATASVACHHCNHREPVPYHARHADASLARSVSQKKKTKSGMLARCAFVFFLPLLSTVVQLCDFPNHRQQLASTRALASNGERERAVSRRYARGLSHADMRTDHVIIRFLLEKLRSPVGQYVGWDSSKSWTRASGARASLSDVGLCEAGRSFLLGRGS